MVGPFLAEYGRRYDRPDLRQQVIRHVLLMQQHTRDPKTGLWFHAWDETPHRRLVRPRHRPCP